MEYVIPSTDTMQGINYVPLYLLGMKKLPDTPEPQVVRYSSLARAISYVRTHKKHWEQVEGSLEFAKKEHLTRVRYDCDRYAEKNETAECKALLEEFLIYSTIQDYFRDNRTPFFIYAARNGNVDLLRYTFDEKKIDVDYHHDTWYGSALFQACEYGQIEAVKYLIDRGASLTKFNGYDNPLHTAAAHGNYECFKYILEKQPDLIHTNAKNYPIIERCLARDAMDCLEGRFKCGQCISGKKGAHPREDVVKILQLAIEKGVDVTADIGWEETALDLVKKNGFTEAIEIIEKVVKEKKEIEQKEKYEREQKEKEEREKTEREEHERMKKEEQARKEKEEQEQKEKEEREQKERVEREQKEKEEREQKETEEREQKEREEREQKEKEVDQKEKEERHQKEKSDRLLGPSALPTSPPSSSSLPFPPTSATPSVLSPSPVPPSPSPPSSSPLDATSSPPPKPPSTSPSSLSSSKKPSTRNMPGLFAAGSFIVLACAVAWTLWSQIKR